MLRLPKGHHFDAVAIACEGQSVRFAETTLLSKKCVAAGDYQQKKGVRSEQRIPTGKIEGFRKFDKVSHVGSEYFIKGRMSTGYAVLMGIDGAKVALKPIPKFESLARVQARGSWITSQKTMLSI